MPNRTQEENDAIMLGALRLAGANGMTVDEVRVALFGEGPSSNSLTKKMLERLKQKGHICIKMRASGPYYMILPGR